MNIKFMLNNYKIGTRLFWEALGMAFWFAILLATALYYMSALDNTADKIYDAKLKPAAATQRIQALMAEVYAQQASALLHNPKIALPNGEVHPVAEHIAAINQNKAAISRIWSDSWQKDVAPEELPLVRTYKQKADAYFTEGVTPLMIAIEADDFNKAYLLYTEKVLPLYQEAVAAAENLRQYHTRSAADAKETAQHIFVQALWVMVAIAVLVTILIAFFSLWLGRSITQPLIQAIRIAESVAAGKLDNPIQIVGHDEVAVLNQSLAGMQEDLSRRVASEREAANENLRIRVALDSSSNSVMMCDPDGIITYCNQAVIEMLREAETDIRQEIPGFNVDHLIGTNFHNYHRELDTSYHSLHNLTEPLRSELMVGGRHFLIVICPVINTNGERLGNVVEWRDRTSEVRMGLQISSIINAAVAGDFGRRLNHEHMSGFFKEIAMGLNEFLDVNNRALSEIGKVLASMSKGDLTHRMQSNYQGGLASLQQDANATVDHLQQIIQSIKHAAETISQAAQEIASGNQDLSVRTEKQASSLQETASSMEELTTTVKHNADNARSANELADNAQQVAERGRLVVNQVVETMGAIHQSSNRIGDIIGVIDSIAFQTNILALNAAVEAARAGEQGRGFAVVASEVRNLAQRSASAAKEIKTLITDSVDKVENGTRLVDRAGQTMSDVVRSIQRVAKLMSDIAEASLEQSAGIEQVGVAIAQMDEATQQNAALVEEAAAAAESLEVQARHLAETVSVFVVDKKEAGQALAITGSMDFLSADADDFLAAEISTESELLPMPPRHFTAVPPNHAMGNHVPPLSIPLTTIDDDWEEF